MITSDRLILANLHNSYVKSAKIPYKDKIVALRSKKAILSSVKQNFALMTRILQKKTCAASKADEVYHMDDKFLFVFNI